MSEASVILAAMWPTPAITVAVGIVALALHLGFYLFQGVWWHAWWALLPAFLPWESIASTTRRMLRRSDGGGSPAASSTGQLAWAIGVVLLLAALQQPVASLTRHTYGFLLSDFPMYSNVYFSTRAEVAAFQERTFQPPPIIRFQAPDGTSDLIEARLRDVDRNEMLSRVAQKVATWQSITEVDTAGVREIGARYAERFGAVPPRVDVLADTWRFDWSIADFTPRHQWKTIATIDLDDGAIEVRHP